MISLMVMAVTADTTLQSVLHSLGKHKNSNAGDDEVSPLSMYERELCFDTHVFNIFYSFGKAKQANSTIDTTKEAVPKRGDFKSDLSKFKTVGYDHVWSASTMLVTNNTIEKNHINDPVSKLKCVPLW